VPENNVVEMSTQLKSALVAGRSAALLLTAAKLEAAELEVGKFKKEAVVTIASTPRASVDSGFARTFTRTATPEKGGEQKRGSSVVLRATLVASQVLHSQRSMRYRKLLTPLLETNMWKAAPPSSSSTCPTTPAASCWTSS